MAGAFGVTVTVVRRSPIVSCRDLAGLDWHLHTPERRLADRPIRPRADAQNALHRLDVERHRFLDQLFLDRRFFDRRFLDRRFLGRGLVNRRLLVGRLLDRGFLDRRLFDGRLLVDRSVSPE